ncbi:MAG: filamentous hemagglutinin N-terminal domain-containing protein, partial [Cyanobacteria bacterium P01_A01_bin.80]
MKGIAFLPGLLGVLISFGNSPVTAQVNSDGTTNTTVNLNGNNFNILNGIQKGNNLFHSFKEFSIPTGSSVNFNNSTDVVNIINRVTGGKISNIDGLIKANGNANLFLINPTGIVFGENASLDIGGSFLGTTAESILFEDGFEFSAVNPQTEPLLTVSVPFGLQMGRNSADIIVNNTGHQLTLGAGTQITNQDTSIVGLQVP